MNPVYVSMHFDIKINATLEFVGRQKFTTYQYNHWLKPLIF